ncbi:MAG: inorganic diphosphatase [Pseudomonadota bacterium]
MIRLTALEIGASPPDEFNVFVTVPAGARPYDVAIDDASGSLTVTKLYGSAMKTPGHIGVVPQTLHDDAPLKVIITDDHPLAAGMVIAARPLGVLYVSSDSSDEVTVLAVPAAALSTRHDVFDNYADLPGGQLREIAHFFMHYRDLELPRRNPSAGWGDVDEARRVIIEAMENARAPLGLADS